MVEKFDARTGTNSDHYYKYEGEMVITVNDEVTAYVSGGTVTFQDNDPYLCQSITITEWELGEMIDVWLRERITQKMEKKP